MDQRQRLSLEPPQMREVPCRQCRRQEVIEVKGRVMLQVAVLPLTQCWACLWEAANGVGEDGVGVELPMLSPQAEVVCPCARAMRRKAKKNEEQRRKTEKKTGENSLQSHLHQTHQERPNSCSFSSQWRVKRGREGKWWQGALHRAWLADAVASPHGWSRSQLRHRLGPDGGPSPHMGRGGNA